jgi:methyl-accepting chemotaxis protein
MLLAERIKNQSDSATTLANEVYKNATTISETLEKFDQLVSEGKDKLKQAESLKSLTEINIKDGKDKLKQTQEKLRKLNNNLEELKRVSSKSNNILTDANKVN